MSDSGSLHYAVVIPMDPREAIHMVPLDTTTLTREQRRALLGYQEKHFQVLDYTDCNFEMHVYDARNPNMKRLNQRAAMIFADIDEAPHELQHHLGGNVLVTGLKTKLLSWEQAETLCRLFRRSGHDFVGRQWIQ